MLQSIVEPFQSNEGVDMSVQLLNGKALQNQIICDIRDLPVMPQIVHEARGILQDPNFNIEDFSNLIETDPVLALKVLKIGNSAYHRRMKEISSVREAAVILGVDALVEFVTLSGVTMLFSKHLKGYDMTVEAMRRHSVAVAYGAKLIAKMKRPQYVHDAFTAGLIHDAGKLILDRYILERKKVFNECMSDDQYNHFETERKILGFDHAVVAEKICLKWNIPKHLAAAIRCHHTPHQLKSNDLAHIIRASDNLVGWIGMDTEGRALDVFDDSIEILGIRAGEVNIILDEILEYTDTVTNIVMAKAA